MEGQREHPTRQNPHHPRFPRWSGRRGPASGTPAELAGYRLFGNQILELLQLARRAPNRKVWTLDDRDAGRVIAAVFERPEATHDDGYRIAGADVAENSTHDLT